MWLADTQFPGGTRIPQNLLDLVGKDFEIRYCKDIRSYKKVFYTAQEFKEDITPFMEMMVYDSWLKTDSEHRYNTFRTLVSEKQLEELIAIEKKESFAKLNADAVKMILETNADLIKWVKSLPSFYETETQIFVHAGVDEEAGEYWNWGTGDEIFLWKFPASLGKFCKTVIAGHIATSNVSKDRSFHEIYHDGASHYYIDGSVYKHGKLLLLGYDEKDGQYYQIESNMKIPVKKFEK